MYNWLPIPPNIDDIENHEHQEERLNELVKGHKEQQLLAKQFFEQRKQEEIEKSIAACNKHKTNNDDNITYMGNKSKMEEDANDYIDNSKNENDDLGTYMGNKSKNVDDTNDQIDSSQFENDDQVIYMGNASK